MKKFLALSLLIPLMVIGCGGKKKEKKATKEVKHGKSMNIPLAQAGDAKSSFFDEEVDAFVLEDGKDAVAVASNDQSVSWVAETDTKTFKPVYFDFDRYSVRPDQEVAMDVDIAEARKIAEKGEKLVVEGHACHSAGSKTYNLLISEHRAQAIAQRLEQAGVTQEQITVVGRGTEMPVVLGGNREEQAPNRRVELFPLAA